MPASGHGRRIHGANRTWRAYLSVERGANAQPGHARDRIGQGPWYNAQMQLVANTVAELHGRQGDAAMFLDERGQRINGQWTGSPAPNEHDILTGSNADGTVAAGLTCADWTSDSAAVSAQVGHSDGFGPNQSRDGTLASWNSAHTMQNCSNTAPRGGAGRFYCFARVGRSRARRGRGPSTGDPTRAGTVRPSRCYSAATRYRQGHLSRSRLQRLAARG